MIHETIKISNSKDSSLVTYILDSSQKYCKDRKRPFVLVIPGGGYNHFGQREQEAIAIKMNSLGFNSAVLYYTLAPMRFPQALVDLSQAVALIRSKAEEWNTDSEKIILCGFSAGGHLASSLGAFWNSAFLKDYISCKSEEIKPNYLLLSYPVVTSEEIFCHKGSIENVIGSIPEDEAEKICKSLGKSSMKDVVSIEKNISKDFPPTFIWHTLEDQAVPAKNTLLLANALYENGIPCEYHLFNRGKHGLALASAETADPDGSMAEKECQIWPQLFMNWWDGLK
ncbi:MAG: alpha/beta hydrolase [Treponema sp.]|nr:alpha/beta hydrolase [Treponema sp.]